MTGTKKCRGVSVKATGVETAAALSYGIVDNIDLVLSLPYLWGKEKENDIVVYDEDGIGDASLEAKIKVFEKEGFSLALKPGISFPTGDDDKGLGTGKFGGQVFSLLPRKRNRSRFMLIWDTSEMKTTPTSARISGMLPLLLSGKSLKT